MTAGKSGGKRENQSANHMPLHQAGGVRRAYSKQLNMWVHSHPLIGQLQKYTVFNLTESRLDASRSALRSQGRRETSQWSWSWTFPPTHLDSNLFSRFTFWFLLGVLSLSLSPITNGAGIMTLEQSRYPSPKALAVETKSKRRLRKSYRDAAADI